jgi:uncharacterized iron-regulated membrane protein
VAVRAVRTLFLFHRYLGIALSPLMVVWCLSGITMMYVSFPSLPELQRQRALPPLVLRDCCLGPGPDSPIAADTPIRQVQVETMATKTVADVAATDGTRTLIDLDTGKLLSRVTPVEAAAVASEFARRLGLGSETPRPTTIQWDQWVTSEQFDADRPFYKFSFRDPGDTEVYVSSVSGRILQVTTRHSRFWNYLGAVPHWIYFSPLRRHGSSWKQLIVWTSLLACFLITAGIYIGLRQYRRDRGRRRSPYRGYMRWHHIAGLVIGALLLSWTASGLLSVNPWRVLEGGSASAERMLLAGQPPVWKDVLGSLTTIASRLQPGAFVSLRSSILAGQLLFIATSTRGTRVRISSLGEAAPLSNSDLAIEAALLGGAQPPELISVGDEFYFAHHSEPIVLPAYRIALSDATSTRYYLDPISGEIVRKLDPQARGYRWLFEGVHRIDFTQAIRSRPLWDLLMLSLLLGATVVCATGLYSALRRVLRRSERSDQVPP